MDVDTQAVLEEVYSLNYEKIRQFKLIDEDYEKADIFVEIDEMAQGLWIRFLGLNEIEDRRQRKEEFYRLKALFSSTSYQPQHV